MIHPAAAAKATSDAASSALVGLRRTHLLPRVKNPLAALESARALANVRGLLSAQERKSNGALDLSRDT